MSTESISVHIKQEFIDPITSSGNSGSSTAIQGNVTSAGTVTKSYCNSTTLSSSMTAINNCNSSGAGNSDTIIGRNSLKRSNSHSNSSSNNSCSSSSSNISNHELMGSSNISTTTLLNSSRSERTAVERRDISPETSPERQLCSSTTSANLANDINCVSINSRSSSSGGGGTGSGSVSGGGSDCLSTANRINNPPATSLMGNGNNSNNGGANSGNSSVGSIRDELRRLCLVCGDVASGFHYGVASCEACKAFFKRTIQGNIEYTCPANNECEINKRRRKACQACRFQKCLLMGMLKEGVRLDRVRGGRQKYRRNPVSNSYQTMQFFHQFGTNSLEDVKILEVLNAYEPDTLSVLQNHQQGLILANNNNNNSGATLNKASNIENTAVTTPPAADTAKSILPTIATIQQIKIENIKKNCAKNLLSPSSSQEEFLSDSDACLATHNNDSNNNNDNAEEILNILSDLYDKELVGIIGWAKQIPGFIELPLNDQMKLLQASWAEILTLQLIFRSLPFNGKLCFATDVWMDELLAKDCCYTEFYNHCVLIAQRMDRLSPRREEYFLLKALLLANCDILLEDQSSLRAFRDSILNAFNDVVYLLRHSAAISHQQQLLLLLPSFRQADNILRQFWRRTYRDSTINMKKLFVEMLEPVSLTK